MPIGLIRHTRLAGAPGLCYGRSEVPLAASFDAEVAAVRAQLPWSPEVVWTSPAARCRRLAERLGGTLREDARLQELHFGAWEGRVWESFRGPESEAWALNPWALRPPGGETGEELWRRVADFRAELARGRAAQRVVVVTHAGVIRAWRTQAEGRTWADSLTLPVEFGALYWST